MFSRFLPTDRRRTCGVWAFRLITRRFRIGVSRFVSTTSPSLYELLRKELLKLDVIHADETPYRVLDSERAKDYIWTFLSGKHAEKPIALYHQGSRKGAEAWDFLTGFSGYLHCDQYPGYLRLSQQDVTLVGCMAHARWKFHDSLPKRESDATSVANQGIHYCNQMFSLERAWEDLSAEERYEKRQSELRPLLEKYCVILMPWTVEWFILTFS